MREKPVPIHAQESFSSHSTATNSEFTELQQLLFGLEQDQIAELQDRLNDLQLRTRDISEVLPEAILERTRQDNRISEALLPNLEQALKDSIQNDPKTLASVLFPIMVPSIRRAITSALREMIQSINQTLEKAFSLQGLKWRIEAFRKKKTIGEIVLLHQLIYRVEQIFLVHRASGLVLQHVVLPEVEDQDPDIVAGMLTAIRDFAHDSFNLQDDTLNSLELGELIIWIEEGPLAYLAIVIRGNAPIKIRTQYQDIIQDVHQKHYQKLEHFNGDVTPFEHMRERLQACLFHAKRPEQERGRPYLTYALAGILLLWFGLWAYQSYQKQAQFSRYVQRLNSTPSFIITKTGKENGRFTITGLRDPLAPEPARLAEQEQLDPSLFREEWTPYCSLQPDFILQRANAMLKPGGAIQLKYDSGTLSAEGSASRTWLETAQRLAPILPGVSRFESKDLVITDARIEQFIESLRATPGYVITHVEIQNGKRILSGFQDPLAQDFEELLQDAGLPPDDFILRLESYQAQYPRFILERIRRILDPAPSVQLELKDHVLHVSGMAPQSWIDRLVIHKNLLSISFGIDAIKRSGLQALEAMIQSIEERVLFFEKSENRIRSDQEEKFGELVRDIQRLISFSTKSGWSMHITIIGHTCDIGTTEENKQLSRERAKNILDRFVAKNLDSSLFTIQEMGYLSPLRKGKTEEDRHYNRRVTFQVEVDMESAEEGKRP